MSSNTIFSFLIRNNIVLILLFFLGIVGVHAQDDSHSELWGTYSSRKYIPSKKIWFRSDYGARSSLSEQPNTTLLARTRLVFSVGNNLELIPAIDFRYSYYADLPNTLEIRTWEGAQLNWPQIKRIAFDHFYRFEQRFYIIEGSAQNGITLRSRYRLRMRIPINKKAITDKTIYADFSFEAFIPHDNNAKELFANTIRVGASVGYNYSTKWRYYLISYVDRGRNNYDNNVTNDRFIISLNARRTLFQTQ